MGLTNKARRGVCQEERDERPCLQQAMGTLRTPHPSTRLHVQHSDTTAACSAWGGRCTSRHSPAHLHPHSCPYSNSSSLPPPAPPFLTHYTAPIPRGLHTHSRPSSSRSICLPNTPLPNSPRPLAHNPHPSSPHHPPHPSSPPPHAPPSPSCRRPGPGSGQSPAPRPAPVPPPGRPRCTAPHPRCRRTA